MSFIHFDMQSYDDVLKAVGQLLSLEERLCSMLIDYILLHSWKMSMIKFAFGYQLLSPILVGVNMMCKRNQMESRV
jgi:hypothetical protein